MNHVISLALIFYAIFSDQFNRIGAKPMTGHNIVNAQANEYPFIVSLMRLKMFDADPELDHLCTGTLITRKDVVTADHCVIVEEPWAVKIIVGSVDLTHGLNHFIFWWITYEQWTATRHVVLDSAMKDVAVVRLIIEVPENIALARIPDIPNYNLYGAEVKMLGWGRSGQLRVNRHLKVGTVKILSHQDCLQRVSAYQNEPVEFDMREAFCTAAEPYVFLSDGDSGGPILVQNYILGVNKGTCPQFVRENERNQVNIHMAINYYKHFITDIITNM